MRHTFGRSVTDWTMDLGTPTTTEISETETETSAPVVAKGPATITFWSAAVGGVQYDDLLNSLGSPVTSIVSSDGSDGLRIGTIPEFQGPPDVYVMWAEAGAGTRTKMVATDIGDTVAGLELSTTYLAALQTKTKDEGAVGQFLGRDPDSDSVTGLRWTSPPVSSGGSGGSTQGVDASSGAYSADKTGGIDARAAIQAAIDDVAAAGGGIVWLPRGTYKIGCVANAGGTGAAGGLQLKAGVWLRGDGIATRLEATGTWSSAAGIVGIGDTATSRPVRDTRVSDMWIKGTAGTSFGTPASNVYGVLFNTASITGEPDAVHRLHDLWIWDTQVGIALLGTDDQAMQVQRIRGRHFAKQGLLVGREDGSGGAADNYFLGVDISSANMGGGSCAGIEVYTSNHHFAQCKSWYNKRSTAFTAGATYKDGAGWYINGTRNIFTSCEAQDNGGHGWLVRLGKNTLTACVADSNNYYDNISGSAAANECSGFYVSSSVTEITLSACLGFDRNGTNKYQKAGFTIDAASRNVAVTGVAWDNRQTSGSATPLDGLVWINGAAHSTHEVRVESAYGSTRATISNGGTAAGGAGTVQKRQDAGGGATVYTGTTMADVPALVATVPGGTAYYRWEAYIIYRADATQNARIGVRVGRDGASGTVEAQWQAEYLTPAGAAASEYSLSSVGTTRYVVTDGDGAVSSSGYSNQRSVRISGVLFAGSVVVTATLAIQVAENGGTGTGVRVVDGSYLVVTPGNYS
ncbi:hypothetical protein [Actinomadura luteofluorescens]|uniref:hypothetical protein n=1 Tax=Actinomadura luteofluorescens TaxID=46163 RepID=UPI003D923EAE